MLISPRTYTFLPKHKSRCADAASFHALGWSHPIWYIWCLQGEPICYWQVTVFKFPQGFAEDHLAEAAWKWLCLGFPCSGAFAHQPDTPRKETDWRWLVPAEFLLLQLIIWFEPRVTPSHIRDQLWGHLPVTRRFHILNFASAQTVCDFSWCLLVLCSVACPAGSFSCLLTNAVRWKAERQTAGSNVGGRSGWVRKCCGRCQAPQKWIKPEFSWRCIMGCQVSKYIGSFCLLDGTADIKLRKGGPAVIEAAVLLAVPRCVFLQHGAVWHEAQQQPPDGGCLERGSRSELWWRLAPPELPLSSAGVRLKLELHEMLMWGGWDVTAPASNPACGERGQLERSAEGRDSESGCLPHARLFPLKGLPLNGFLAWQVLPSLTSLCPPPWGKARRLAVTKMSEHLLLHSQWKWEHVAPRSSRAERDTGDPGCQLYALHNVLHGKQKQVSSDNKAVQNLSSAVSSCLASEDYFILVTESPLTTVWKKRTALVLGHKQHKRIFQQVFLSFSFLLFCLLWIWNSSVLSISSGKELGLTVSIVHAVYMSQPTVISSSSENCFAW